MKALFNVAFESLCCMGCVLLCFVLVNPLSVCSKKSLERLVIFRLKENILPSSRLVDSVECVKVCACGFVCVRHLSVFMSQADLPRYRL